MARLIEVLNDDGLAIVRTDTIYGIIAKASSQKAVEKVYALKQRDLTKPCIVLLSSPYQAPSYADILATYSVDTSRPTSVVVPASSEPAWLRRGGSTVAYRVVCANAFFADVIAAVGPVIAPSANRQGEPPFRTIEAARRQFGEAIDYYCDGGVVPETIQPSRIIRVTNNPGVSSSGDVATEIIRP